MNDTIPYVTLTIGSKLWGTDTPDSDTDFLTLLCPSKAMLVSNRRETVPTEITDTQDTRYRLLGDFVMGLGSNVEDTLIALQYPRLLGPLVEYYLRDDFAGTVHDAAASMRFGAKSPKQLAHAVRTFWFARAIANGSPRITPFTPELRESFLLMRSGDVGEMERQLELWRVWEPSPVPIWPTGPRNSTHWPSS